MPFTHENSFYELLEDLDKEDKQLSFEELRCVTAGTDVYVEAGVLEDAVNFWKEYIANKNT